MGYMFSYCKNLNKNLCGIKIPDIVKNKNIKIY
jgi:hypothetical protein